MKKLFLSVGLILAVIVGLTVSAPGATLKSMDITPWLVVIIFLINGYQTKLNAGHFSGKLIMTFVFAVILGLFISPVIAVLIAETLNISLAIALGLLVMSSMPPTLSSGIVLTENAEGNIVWAMLLTVGMNLLAIFTIPFILSVCMTVEGEVHVSSIDLLWKLLKMVLIPFLAGKTLSIIIRKKLPYPATFIPSICVVLAVWVAVSSAAEKIVSAGFMNLLLIVILVASIHIFLLVANKIAGKKLLKLSKKEAVALLFVGSQKTLPISISVLAALSSQKVPGTGLALIVCICFHFFQLLLDSSLIPFMKTEKNL